MDLIFWLEYLTGCVLLIAAVLLIVYGAVQRLDRYERESADAKLRAFTLELLAKIKESEG